MIIIENTEVLELVTDATAVSAEPSWLVGYVSATDSTFNQAISQSGAATGTTAVAIVTGVLGQQLRVMSISIYNRDTVPRTITIRRSATVLIIKALVVAGGSIQYMPSEGWEVHDVNGLKQHTGATGPIGPTGPAGPGDALTANPLSQFASTTSLQLKNVISDETGSGALVFATSPALVTPLLGMPTSGNLNNCVLNWPSVKKVVPLGETAIIPSDCQMTVKGPFRINGIVLNSGEIFIN